MAHDTNAQSDHVVVTAHLQLHQKIERGIGRWKNNPSVYQNEFFKDEFSLLWQNWKKTSKTTCPVRFWVDAKKKIKNFLIDIGKLTAAEKKRYKDKKSYIEQLGDYPK